MITNSSNFSSNTLSPLFQKANNLVTPMPLKSLGKALLALATLVSATIILYKYFKRPVNDADDNKPTSIENEKLEKEPETDKKSTALPSENLEKDSNVVVTLIEELIEAVVERDPKLKDKNFALQQMKVNPESFDLFDENIRKDEDVIFAYLSSPNLDLKASKNEFGMKYFFLSSKLQPFFGNFKVMNACLLLIDKMEKDQQKFFLAGIDDKLSIDKLNGNESPLLDNHTFMHALLNRDPDLTPDYSHSSTMSNVSPKKKHDNNLFSKFKQATVKSKKKRKSSHV